MVIDAKVLDNLSERAKGSERLRMNLDLRNSSEDGAYETASREDVMR